MPHSAFFPQRRQCNNDIKAGEGAMTPTINLGEILLTIEIGSAGVVSTFAAYSLGLQRLDMLMTLFFSMTLAGQLLTAALAKVRSPL